MTRKYGIAHLSLLDLDAPELIETAAEAGFDFVGIRVRGATPLEVWPSYVEGSRELREVRAALKSTGVYVGDIEFLAITAQTSRAEWLPMLQAGSALGARTISLAGADDNPDRLTENLAALTQDASDLGLTPTLEPISYNSVATVGQAAKLAEAAGCAILVDSLHLARSGGQPSDLTGLDPQLIPVLQLCDALRETPTEIMVTGPLPRGMTAEGEPRKVESRALRRVPGEGELPIAEIISQVNSEVPISVEVPNMSLRCELGALRFAQRLYDSVVKYR